MKLPPIHPAFAITFGFLSILMGLVVTVFGALMTQVVLREYTKIDQPGFNGLMQQVQDASLYFSFIWNFITFGLIYLVKMDLAPAYEVLMAKKFGTGQRDEIEQKIDQILVYILIGVLIANLGCTFWGAWTIGWHPLVALGVALIEVPATELLINVGIWAFHEGIVTFPEVIRNVGKPQPQKP